MAHPVPISTSSAPRRSGRVLARKGAPMNKCLHCGPQNESVDADTAPHVKPQTPMSMAKTVGMWVAAWAVTGAVVAAIGTHYPKTLLGFPGAVLFVGPDLPLPMWVAGKPFCCAGWLYYVALTLWGLRSRRRSRYYLAYAVLCLSLVLNVLGWYHLEHWRM
jgi:hypothetical protein